MDIRNMMRQQFWGIILALLLAHGGVMAQVEHHDSVMVIYPEDTLSVRQNVSVPISDSMMTISRSLADSPKKENVKEKHHKRDWATWRPNAKRALWLALVLPGAGQVYNRKFWKLPIIYGGFTGCIYAMTWNNQMYHDYSQAYMDIMDNDPTTESYKNFLHLGTEINESNKSRYQEIFRKRKNRYRRWRDLSIFASIAVHALSVIDAYVDASLSEFDISEDLSMRVTPVVLGNDGAISPQCGLLGQNAIGLGCSLRF